jgi:hypothetical protein
VRLKLVRSSIALRFEVEEDRLLLHRWGPASFLLTLPSVEMADLIYNGGRPFITSSVRLHIMRWTRFLNATASCLPSAVEVEIRGIPAHAWELSTAELLLDEWCWVDGLHPSVPERRDVFKLKAWRVHAQTTSLRKWNWRSWSLQWRIVPSRAYVLCRIPSQLWSHRSSFQGRTRLPHRRRPTKDVDAISNMGGALLRARRLRRFQEARRRRLRVAVCQCMSGWAHLGARRLRLGGRPPRFPPGTTPRMPPMTAPRLRRRMPLLALQAHRQRHCICYGVRGVWLAS